MPLNLFSSDLQDAKILDCIFYLYILFGCNLQGGGEYNGQRQQPQHRGGGPGLQQGAQVRIHIHTGNSLINRSTEAGVLVYNRVSKCASTSIQAIPSLLYSTEFTAVLVHFVLMQTFSFNTARGVKLFAAYCAFVFNYSTLFKKTTIYLKKQPVRLQSNYMKDWKR